MCPPGSESARVECLRQNEQSQARGMKAVVALEDSFANGFGNHSGYAVSALQLFAVLSFAVVGGRESDWLFSACVLF